MGHQQANFRDDKQLGAQISELESTKRQMIPEMKNTPSDYNKPKSGGGSSVSGYPAKTEFGGSAEKADNK